ncbi:MAG: VOC family protein [Halieaceae bacterium]
MTDTPGKIHHINFLVKDLDQAEASYRGLLGLPPGIREELPARGVLTARFRVGDTWLVLLQPTTDEGEPARHLREQGEGFFLISFGVDDLDAAIDRVTAAGGRISGAGPRCGLAGWRIVDIDAADTFGAQLQLTEDVRGSGAE